MTKARQLADQVVPDSAKPISTATQAALDAKQAALVSGTNIKTVNSTSLLGSGNVAVGDVTLTGTQTLTNKTLMSPALHGAVLNDGYTEEVATLAGNSIALNPPGGSIALWTLPSNSSVSDAMGSGQSLILGVTAGGYTITWPTVTWSKVGGSGTAPTLTSTGVNWIIFWKTGTTLRGAFLGTA